MPMGLGFEFHLMFSFSAWLMHMCWCVCVCVGKLQVQCCLLVVVCRVSGVSYYCMQGFKLGLSCHR